MVISNMVVFTMLLKMTIYSNFKVAVVKVGVFYPNLDSCGLTPLSKVVAIYNSDNFT